MLVKTTVILFVLVCISACTPYYLYHSPNNSCLQENKHLDSCNSKYIERTDGYSLGFVEIDDKGWFWDENQLSAIVQEIEKHDDVLLLVYAHGWKHNADNGDRDVKRMRDTLKQLAYIEERNPSGPRKVLGLYIGWRGLSVTVPIAKELSFWERKATAENAGQSAAQIMVKLQYYLDKKRAKGSHSSFVIVGHSFGGALVFSAIKPLVLSRLDQSSTVFKKDNQIGDLVVLLNPAFEATKFTAVREAFKNKKGIPYMVVLTADNDKATRRAFPVGKHLNTLFDKYRSEAQKNADRRTIGHYKPYFTHMIEDIEGVEGNGCGSKYQPLKTEVNMLNDSEHINQWVTNYSKEGHQLELDDTIIRHIDDKEMQLNPDNPIQVIRVKDRDILDKHSNIVCDDLVDLIRSYIIFQFRYENQ